MKVFDCVTVPLSLSENDLHLLGYAAMLAEMGVGQRYQFVHVVVPGVVPAGMVDHEEVLQRMRRVVQQVWGGLMQRVDTRLDVREGVRVDQLLSYVAECACDLILLGHRSNRSGKRSLAQRLAMISPSSVWMVPDQIPCRISAIMAPIDFSSHSAESLAIATQLAASAGLEECLAVHVFFDPSTIRYDEHVDEVRGDEQRAFAKFVRSIRTPGVRIVPHFEEASNVTRALLRVAEQRASDLIVMSTRGRSPAASILLGSETAQTLMESKIPVLAVKHRGAKVNLIEALLHGGIWSKPNPKTN